MRRSRLAATLLAGSALATLATAAGAQTTTPASNADSTQIEEIVVTAQKREEQINDVPVSITAATSEQLADAGVNDIVDLPKLVPGLTYTPSLNATPILTLRGIGFNEYTLGASPTVSVYNDQVPLPFLPMARGGTYDLERVEVLKGPQGILFGQNSTGGAINYIPARPSQTPEAGFEVGYGRFEEATVAGYATGPITDTLAARLSVRTVQSGPWQRNFVTGQELGEQNFTEGRLQLAWEPNDDVTLRFALSGWKDRSDTLGSQLVGFRLQTTTQPVRGALITAQPLSPDDARATNFGSNVGLDRDDSFLQASLRADVDLSEMLTLTSITSFDRFEQDFGFDRDGSRLRILDVNRSVGEIEDVSQELRLAGDLGRFTYVVGANYFTAEARSLDGFQAGDATNTVVVGNAFDVFFNRSDLDIEEYAAFGSGEFALTDTLTLLGGLRYTNSERSYAACTLGDAGLSRGLTVLSTVLSGTPTPLIPTGECVTLQANLKPGLFTDMLEEDNVSWRAGANYEPNADTLLYANVTKGYKAGSYPTLSASTFTQFLPVTQESVTAYEAGFKLTLAERRVQLNGAAFHYDYTDKQVRGNVVVPVFQVLERLVNVPKSRITGAELQLLVVPVAGLTINTSATYLDTEIEEFVGLNQFRVLQDFSGQPIPYTPALQATADVEYRFVANAGLEAFVGALVAHNSETSSAIDTPAFAAIPEFTTLDLRIGIGPDDRRWTLTAYGRNVTDEFSWTNAFATQDVIVRYAAKPRTYGVRFAYTFQ